MIDGGDVDGAECLRQALELAPRTDWTRANAEDWFAVGETLLCEGDDLGIDCLEQAIRIDPARTDLASFLSSPLFGPRPQRGARRLNRPSSRGEPHRPPRQSAAPSYVVSTHQPANRLARDLPTLG